MTHQRDRIHEYIATHPGEHFNALTRRLDLAPGQVQYHLRKLQNQERVVNLPLYGRTHYYTPEYDAWERGAIAVLRRETARDILFCVLEQGTSSPNAVTESLGIARGTLEWHLDHLTEQNLIEKHRDVNNHVTLVAAERTETARLLEEISPSLSDRMIDRFTRLVDNLLADGS
ncbi:MULTISPECIES: winged helix-turn-helix transcriptional regulator [Halobacteriales]|jgi:predicted transcriptional regulator|uniref:Transcription regulator n=4 Tax=Halobacteriales TaxID=2235 RepID=Q5V753_HALMA|nr:MULTISPECIES: winged helix-turn-helix transcriptional regulator [Halobacteria]AAV44641.1 transcription regulator [Haloarcula marismortui ATCC 43049]EMA27562.1 transcription regulator [Haloarcula japonica DSM 6131]KAB7513602.1 winged helix-turn-helix transcriptional regulator [Halosegnis rubeus]QCP89516.1 winged helix-turn-helix transcriptional regulator [Haloarcula marismortui ATCC 43049]QZY04718.1 winged helix-turn-helix transcriptional regulator [Halobaculum roseum]